MGIALELLLGALGVYWIHDMGYPWWMAVTAVVVVYLLVTRGLGIGGAGAGVIANARNMFAGIGRFVIGIAVFVGVMMIATHVIGVPNSYATHEFVGLGWRFWLWPQGFHLDLLLWVAVAFLMAGVADRASHGNTRAATWIFGGTVAVIILTTWFPRNTSALVPTPTASMPSGATTLEKVGQSAVERGVPSVVAEVAVKAGLGNSKNIVTNGVLGESGSRTGELFLGTPPDKKTSGVVGSFFKRSWTWAFGEPAPPATSVSSGTPPSTPVTRQVVQLPDCATPCSLDIEEIRDLYTDGEAIEILPPGWTRDKAIAYPGRGHLVLSGGNIRSGIWQFFSADPSKVVLIRAFVLR